MAGARVLEVGAGCGVAGLAAAVAGAGHVELTDFDDDVCDNLRRNVVGNCHLWRTGRGDGNEVGKGGEGGREGKGGGDESRGGGAEGVGGTIETGGGHGRETRMDVVHLDYRDFVAPTTSNDAGNGGSNGGGSGGGDRVGSAAPPPCRALSLHAERIGQIDLLVGSECVYYEGCASLAAACRLLLRPRTGVALFCLAKSRKGLRSFVDAVRQVPVEGSEEEVVAEAAGVKEGVGAGGGGGGRMYCEVTPVPDELLERCRGGREELGEGNSYSFFRVGWEP